MRVLSVIIANPLRKVNGATIAGRELSLATSRLVDMDLAVMWDEQETSYVDGLRILRRKSTIPLGFLGGLLPRSARIALYRSDIPRLIREGHYALVHLHNLVPALAAGRVAAACSARGIPYIVSGHGFHELHQFAQISGFGPVKSVLSELAIVRPAGRIIRNASGIFCLTDRDPSLLATRLPTRASVVRVVTNGVEESFLAASSVDELAAVRERFGLDAKRILLFYMGSLYKYKGVEIFLRALDKLDVPFEAVIGGSFWREDDKDRLLREAGLDDARNFRVIFTGKLSLGELRALYQLADIFVYPTQGDSLPLVVLEAMASRLPVVSTTVGGIPYAVTPDSGILVPPGDSLAIARAIAELASDPERRRRLGHAGRARVERTFRWSLAAHAAVDGYRAVLAKAHNVRAVA